MTVKLLEDTIDVCSLPPNPIIYRNSRAVAGVSQKVRFGGLGEKVVGLEFMCHSVGKASKIVC